MAAHAKCCPNLDIQQVRTVSAQAEAHEIREKEKRTRRGKAPDRSNTENELPRITIHAASTVTTPLSRHGSSSSRLGDDLEPPPAKRFKPTPHPEPIWDEACQTEVAHDLCKLFAACGISWNVIDNPQFHLFFEKWLPRARIPDRRALSGSVLNTVAEEAVGAVKVRVAGKLAMGQSDGWKNIARTNVISSVMSVDHQVRTYTGRGVVVAELTCTGHESLTLSAHIT